MSLFASLSQYNGCTLAGAFAVQSRELHCKCTRLRQHYDRPLLWPHTATTVYPKKYAHGFCFAVLCCGYTLTDFPISIRLTSLALWQSNDCPSANKATLMNMDKYFMWIQYERLHYHNKAKHNKTVCTFLEIYCKSSFAAKDCDKVILLDLCFRSAVAVLTHSRCDWAITFYVLCLQGWFFHVHHYHYTATIACRK